MESLGCLEDYIVWMGCSGTNITSGMAMEVAVSLMSMHEGVSTVVAIVTVFLVVRLAVAAAAGVAQE